MHARLLSLCLAVLLALTSVETAAARAAPQPADSVVLCTGLERVVIHLDRDGRPVRQSVLCPDAGDALLALDPETLAFAPREGALSSPRWAGSARHATGRRGPAPRARAPPAGL